MDKSKQKTPVKSQAKDIRSFFKKPEGPQGAAKVVQVVEKNNKPLKGEKGAPSSLQALKPVAVQKTVQQNPKPSTPAEAKPAAKRRNADVIDDEDDENVIVVQRPVARKENKGAAPAVGSGKGRGSGVSAAPVSDGRCSDHVPASKRRRLTADDEDENLMAESSSDDDDEDFEDLDDEQSSGSEDEDVVMASEEDDGGSKRKQKAAKLPPRVAKKAGTNPSRSRSPAAAAAAATTKRPASTAKAAAAVKAAEANAERVELEGSKKAGRTSSVSASGAAAAAAAATVGGSARKSSASKKPAAFSLDPNAEAAIEAVNKAVEQLPAEGQINFSLMPEGGEAAGNDSAQPPNYRNKEVPRGHPDCLTGRTIVISGVLDSLMRPEAEDLIKRHGGKVTQSVSGRTAFLLVGHNCGRSKYRSAKQHSTKLIDEDGLFALLRASAPFAPAERPAVVATPTKAGPNSIPASNFFSSTAAAGTGIAGPGPSAARKPVGPAGTYPAPGPSQPPAGGGGGSLNQLWVDKYKPRNSSELVGNNTLVANLKQWLESWEQVHLRGAAPPTAKGGGSKPKDLSKKAALLSGPPGIGKTSAAHIIAGETGFEVVEMNASDTRNKSGKVSDGIAGKQSNVIKEMVSNTTLPGLGAAHGGGSRRQLLIMDEVDGMSGGDRGGIQDLIDTIKRSKIPIICICNDKYNQKLRSLRTHCMELEFRKPTVQQISKRMSEICQREGLQVNQATMDALVTGAGGDLRLILGQLQMVRLRARALTYDEVRGKMGASKDTDMSPFECARRLLEPACSHLSISERMELVFADMDLVPLLVQENYLNHRPIIAPEMQSRLRAMAKSADSISFGDVVNNALRRSQNWGLMPFAGIMSCVLPAAYMRGPREIFGLYPTEMNFPRFTAWLGNYSSSNKQRRLLGELSVNMAASGRISSSRSAVRLEYVSALRHLLVQPLVREQEAAVPAIVELMHGYCIDREQLDFILDITSFKSKAAWAEDTLKDVPTKVKSAFTRSLNSTAPAARCLAQVEEVKLGRGAGKGKAKGRKAAVDEDDDEGALEGEDMEQDAKPTGKAAGEGGQDEQEDEDVDAATLARRLAKDGMVLQLQDDGKAAKGKKSGGGGGRGGGGGAAKAAGGRGGGTGRGGGRGGGKAAAKK